jgi:hypothetical protein
VTRPKPKSCKDCVAEAVTTKRPANYPGPRCSSHHKARRAQTRDTTWEKRILALYGLSADEYERIKAFQGGRCAICQRATGAVRRLAVDHDHATGVVRGCLCKTCNVRVLGHARDQIDFFERCIDYLTNPPAVQVIGRRIAPIELANLTLNDDG